MDVTGDKFTWGRVGVRECLDIVVCNSLFINQFQKIVVINEEHYRFDHRSVLVDTEYYDVRQINN